MFYDVLLFRVFKLYNFEEKGRRQLVLIKMLLSLNFMLIQNIKRQKKKKNNLVFCFLQKKYIHK